MAHGIETTDGRANMAYTGRTPWHDLGQNIEEAFDAETALKEANLDWEVELAPLYFNGANTTDPSVFTPEESTKGSPPLDAYNLCSGRHYFSYLLVSESEYAFQHIGFFGVY